MSTPKGTVLHFLPQTPLHCSAIKKKKFSYTRKGGKEKHVTLSGQESSPEAGAVWAAGERITSLTVGCHLNAATGPAIIPFTVLDSGMVRSYRGKGRWSRCWATSGRCPPAPDWGSLLTAQLQSHSTPNETPSQLHGLHVNSGPSCLAPSSSLSTGRNRVCQQRVNLPSLFLK